MAQQIAIFVGDDYEDLELWYPKLRLLEAGFEVRCAGLEKRVFRGKNGYPCSADCLVSDLDASKLAGVILVGGWMPDKLRRDAKVKQIISELASSGKLVAAVCHGGWMAVSANVYKGVKITGSPGIKDDCVNAGAVWEEAACVVDRHFVSSRKPDDLPDFMKGCLAVLGR